MKKFRNIKPTESELEILNILWTNSPVTVKYVNDELNKSKETGYTTTLKLMQIMHEKGLLTREKEGRSHLYSPAIEESETKQAILDKMLETAFGGSAGKLVMQALGNNKTTSEELQQIKKMIEKLEEEK
ncbi:MAG: BlaI/MecI/CopY family transcriptional regulator [Melioribacteraceae bacterium]|nr:BlaI/MecI/CopY family transcriptional regulator [Melioribacteraceae bacterium]MDD3557136.1 BlaI/MecI/CopY family transcriptional regulator [Melioribacteraceae bacterium]